MPGATKIILCQKAFRLQGVLSSMLFSAYHILMRNTPLKDAVMRILPRVQTPAQYLGGELNSIVKDHRKVRGKLCLAFPDAYTLGMSHHGLQVLYTIMNRSEEHTSELQS